MFKKVFKQNYLAAGAALTTGLLTGAESAHAQNNFNSITDNIISSIANLPGLISAMAYLMGILLSVLGVMKIKDHVENPSQTPLKDGAIRLAAGGALFALPIITEAMFETIGDGSAADVADMNAISLGIGSGGGTPTPTP